MSASGPVVAALVYARRGWAVMPCYSARAGACTCGDPACASPAKHPRVRTGLHAATTDRARIEAWWARWPGANVAIRTGAVSGLVVLDVDRRHGGEHSLARLEACHGPLPAGRTVRTGDGAHRYFAHPGEVAVPNGTGQPGPGIDVRGDGGYVLAPPSRHRSGRRYEVLSGGATLPPLPRWALDILAPTTGRPPGPRPSAAIRDGSAWGRAALRDELARLGGAKVGHRNDALNRSSYRMGRLVGAGALDEGATADALREVAVGLGLTPREAEATTGSGLAAGMANPRVDPAPSRSARPAPPPPRAMGY